MKPARRDNSGLVESVQHTRIRRAAVVSGLFVLLIGSLTVWRAHVRSDFVAELQRQASASGVTLRLETVSASLWGDAFFKATVDLGPEVSITSERVVVRKGLLSAASILADGAHFELRGTPVALWDRWIQTESWQRLPITFANSSADYRGPSIGHVALMGAELTRDAVGYRLVASQLSFNGKRWDDVSLLIGRPNAIVKVDLVDQNRPGTPFELRYFPTQGKAAEWMLAVPSQPLAALLARLGAGAASTPAASRVAGSLSVFIFDDPKTLARANLQLVIDNWFMPAWPDAAALTGRSGSIGMRLEPTQESRLWRVTRVEVAAATFALTGTGTLALGEPTRLSFSARGTRTCAQLAAHLPASTYRQRVARYLEQASPPSKGNEPGRAIAANADQTPTVELSLTSDVTMGIGGHSSFVWHLGAGCGLEELTGEAAPSGT
ncbi:MAG TPA: hypothetical protein VIV60_31975 [Polyangiaceae bacterium]